MTIASLYHRAKSFASRAHPLLGYICAEGQDKHQIRQILHEAAALEYFSRYLYAVNAPTDTKCTSTSDASDQGGAIWQLWFQGFDVAPEIVKSCLKSVTRHLPDQDHVVLDEKRIENYVCLPGYVYDKRKLGQISTVKFSDVLRVCLLAEHGGTWMDATVYLTAPPPMLIRQLPLFFFSRTPNELLGRGHVLGSSWYLHAARGNILIESVKRLLLEYWKHESDSRHHYDFHLMLTLAAANSEACRRCLADMPFYSNVPPHVMQMELFKPYSARRLEEIEQMSHVHKLTFYGGAEFDAARTGTLYRHLIAP